METKLTFNSKRSLSRPAWTQCDLYAFNHKHQYNSRTKKQVVFNHFVRTKGF